MYIHGKRRKVFTYQRKKDYKNNEGFCLLSSSHSVLEKKKKKQLIAEQYCDGNMAQENNVMIIGPAGQTELNKKVLTNS